jgi:hypothetical protein
MPYSSWLCRTEVNILRLRWSGVHLTAMRGDERVQDGMFSYVSLEERVPQDGTGANSKAHQVQWAFREAEEGW